MLFKDFFDFKLWQSFYLDQQIHYFGKRHFGEHSCENILNLDQWFRGRCTLTLEEPITTAADDKFGNNFPNFPKNKV